MKKNFPSRCRCYARSDFTSFFRFIVVSNEDIDKAGIQAITDGDEKMTISPGAYPRATGY